MKTKFIKLFIVTCCVIFPVTGSAIGTISGIVTYHDQFGVADITLYLYDNNENLIDSTITNPVGFYLFNQIPFGDYILRGNTDMLSVGVDLEDAYMIEQYLLGNDTLSDFQKFCADVDGDREVTWDDYYIITDWWLTYGIPFPIGDWKFEEIQIAYYTVHDGEDNEAKVTSTGDVNGGGLPDRLIPVQLDLLNFEKIVVKEKDVFEVPVYIENDISILGYHFALKYNSDVLEILNVKSLGENSIFHMSDGTLRITCMNNNNVIHQINPHIAIATITIKLKETSPDSDLISLSGSSSQFLDETGKLINNIQMGIPKIEIVSEDTDENFEIIDNYPNPFISTTSIEYKLPQAGEVTICIYNVSGQLIDECKTKYKEAGIHKYQFDGSNIPSGMYMYRIVFACPGQKENIKTKTMIKSN